MTACAVGYAGTTSRPHDRESTTNYLVRATRSSSVARFHVVRVFDRRPDVKGAQELAARTFRFGAVKETLSAAANTAGSVSRSPSTAVEQGQTRTVTVTGKTGAVGNRTFTWSGRAPRAKSLTVYFRMTEWKVGRNPVRSHSLILRPPRSR